ncbi:hypothetical protein BGZ73_005671 [Actinomortierella ambigua]|nr:hypothetical protein BGZ73_005671 [Actinomortierella ambigua]
MAHVNFGHFPTLPQGVPRTSTHTKNSVMRKLVQLFPEVDLAWLRHQIQQHEHSHFYKVIDTMLGTYVNTQYPQRMLPNVGQRPGQLHRRRLQRNSSLPSSSRGKNRGASAGENDNNTDDDFGPEPLIEPWEYIRSPEYIKCVRRQLYNEFPKVWKSTIKAVMAENNFDYVRTYDRLLQLETENSWSRWFSDVLSFIQRAKISKSGVDPPEFLEDLAAFHRRERDRQSAQDQTVAQELNTEEYRTHGQTIECGCCYSDFCFEEMAACQEGHLFCKDCIQRYVQEGLFGQGELRGAGAGGRAREGGNTLAHAIRCIESSGCQALFSEAMLEWALTPAMYEQYTRVAFQADLDRSGLEMVGCPFCDYAEVDEPLRFRAIAGPCTQCTKCDLYIVEKDEEAARKAARAAQAEYLRMNPMARQHLQNDQALIGPPTDNTLEDLAYKIRLNAENLFEFLFIEDATP